MPRPQAVIDGFTKLMKLIEKGEAVGYKKYRLNNDWYKRNQREVLERTAPVLGAGEGAAGTPRVRGIEAVELPEEVAVAADAGSETGGGAKEPGRGGAR